MTDTSRAPRSVVIAFALLSLLAAGWCIYWFAFRTKLQGDVAEFRAGLAAQGLQQSCASEVWSGFPFRYELTCLNPRLTGERNGQRVEIAAAQLQLVMQAYNPFHIIGLVDGPTSVNGKTLAHDKARSSLLYDLQGNWDAAIELPAASLPDVGSANMLKLFARQQGGKLQLAANAETLVLPLPDASTAGIASASIVAETDAALLASDDPLRQAANAGTPLTLTSLVLEQGATTITGSGSFTLDSARKLNGKLQSEVNDLDGLLALLAAPLKLTPEQLDGARTVIGLIGGNKPGQPAKVDIIAKAGELYFGPFKIADVPPLE